MKPNNIINITEIKSKYDILNKKYTGKEFLVCNSDNFSECVVFGIDKKTNKLQIGCTVFSMPYSEFYFMEHPEQYDGNVSLDSIDVTEQEINAMCPIFISEAEYKIIANKFMKFPCVSGIKWSSTEK